jgi:hypothetical protein
MGLGLGLGIGTEFEFFRCYDTPRALGVCLLGFKAGYGMAVGYLLYSE